LADRTERIDPETIRLALDAALHQAERKEAFENSRFIGLALDGTGSGRTAKEPCPLCDCCAIGTGATMYWLRHGLVRLPLVEPGYRLPACRNFRDGCRGWEAGVKCGAKESGGRITVTVGEGRTASGRMCVAAMIRRSAP